MIFRQAKGDKLLQELRNQFGRRPKTIFGAFIRKTPRGVF